MCDLPSLPLHIEELLKKIVGEDCSIIVDASSCKLDNLLGDVIKARTNGMSKKGEAEINFIVKRSPTNKTLRESVPVNLFYGREIYAYSMMLPTLYKLQDDSKLPIDDKFSYAKYYSDIKEENKETVVLEDLSKSGFKEYDRSKPLDKEHAEFAIKTLARFHATSFVLQRKNKKMFDELASHAAQELEYGDMLGKVKEVTKEAVLQTMEQPENREKVSVYLLDMMDKFQKFVKPEAAAPYNVLCHGDCWTNNFMFLYENSKIKDMRFLDWQITRLASPITDIAYMMYSSTVQELRSNYLEQALDLYYETLKINITAMGCHIQECYPEDVFRDHVKTFMPFGLITSFIVIPGTLCDDDDDDY